MARGLSPLQQWILGRTLRHYAHVEAHGTEYARRQLPYWGAPWYPSRWHPQWTPSDRAATARAVTRLVQRGLVERTNHVSTDSDQTPRRAVGLRLTEDGRATAERLAKTVAETKPCARCGALFGPRPRERPSSWARRRYCSPTCGYAPRSRVPYLTCSQCGARFWSQDRGQRFCSRACAHQARQAEYARRREQWVSHPR